MRKKGRTQQGEEKLQRKARNMRKVQDDGESCNEKSR